MAMAPGAPPGLEDVPEAVQRVAGTMEEADVEENCPDCKHLLETGSNFCRMCGRKLYAERNLAMDLQLHIDRSAPGLDDPERTGMPPPGFGAPAWPYDPMHVHLQSFGYHGAAPFGYPGAMPPFGYHGAYAPTIPAYVGAALVPESSPKLTQKLERIQTEPPAWNANAKVPDQLEEKAVTTGGGRVVSAPPTVPVQPGLERTTTLTSLKADPSDTGCSIQWTVEAKKVLEARDKVAVSSAFVVKPLKAPAFPGNFKIILQPKVSHERKGGACFKSAKGQCLIQVKWSGDSRDEKVDLVRLKEVNLKIALGIEAETGSAQTQRHNFADEGVCRLLRDDSSEEWDFAKAAGEKPRTVVVKLDIALDADGQPQT